MEQNYTDKTFLARWLNNELTDEELSSFVKSEHYIEYKKITDGMSFFEPPSFNQEKVLEKIQQQIHSRTKVKQLIPKWAYTTAAAIALLFSVIYFTSDSKEVYTTSFGEQLAVVLPDGSEVQLNAKSKLTYVKEDWVNGNRTLNLEGEAYFKVQLGTTFSVQTLKGNVRVLGTQFNVKQTDSYFVVYCYEGKVSVANTEEKVILSKGNSFRKIDGQLSEKNNFYAITPSWITGESSFESTALKFVLAELEKQYQIKIKKDEVDVEQLFTGSFTNENLTTALQTICAPLGIDFKVDKKTVSLTKIQ